MYSCSESLCLFFQDCLDDVLFTFGLYCYTLFYAHVFEHVCLEMVALPQSSGYVLFLLIHVLSFLTVLPDFFLGVLRFPK